MNLQPNGNFRLTPGEVVTVAVTALNTMYLAIFSDLLVATWNQLEAPEQVAPGQVREIRQFTTSVTAPSRESFTILFDFVRKPGAPLPPGAEYVVELRGTSGAPIQVPVPPVPPFPVDQQFVFEVRQ